MKRILRSEAVQTAAAILIAAYVRLVHRLTRWTVIGEEELRQRVEAGQPCIVAVWHGRMIEMPNLWRYTTPIYLLGSPHRDGRLILQVVGRFGIQPILGSSSRGGPQALRTMVQTIRGGSCIGIAPDGPRGPRMRAASGVIALAKLSGAPIISVTFSTARGRLLTSWDRCLLPLPFGRGAVIYGEPVVVPADADDAALETARLALETRLNQITAEADRLCGRAPVAPAPPVPSAATPAAEVAETGA